MANSPYDASKKRPIRGHSHVPRMAKGVYNVGSSPTGRLDYNQGPTSWTMPRGAIVGGRQNGKSSLQAAMAEQMMEEMKQEMDAAKMSGMCGDCIGNKVTGGHDPKVDKRRKCQLCGTVWPGLEPDNDRRGAILAQKARKQ